ncbi:MULTISPECIES: VanZ family protein [unclassified Rhizobium]|uniref:VanZ family protein n=1 Tax=unclassified Rhizobium TaxID=2613769 RepID=UPI001613E246|nr:MULTISPECIES: VanZ family protein [unclassified Rhizobium]MBB3318101.1 putative membrane protein [Rhizobium sp. BK181]MBB3544981.1 putative membrane protein [Rhizobium sp. BK399]MCS3742955.1 putative membrane protein [Rhizobium sp. BK661]MCS4095577.1 putative membrane protein [Rhizobium sp. BK176]
MDRLIKTAAWLWLGAIVFVTVSPIGMRPHDVMPVNYDRALAFTLMAGLFVMAYPRQFLTCAILVIAGAAAMELLQYLSASRHARLDDAAVKALGATIGVAFGYAANRLRRLHPFSR